MLSGHVFKEDSSKPLSNVNISVVGKSTGGTTNDLGYFEIRVEVLPTLLYFSHIGYGIDQVLATKSNRNKIKIFLTPETTTLEEVTISAERIQKVSLGDTLNVIDYAIIRNRILLVASPFRRQSDQRLYLTDLQGKQLYNLPVSNMGKRIKIPEHMMPEQIYLFEDFLGSYHVLTRKMVQQIDLSKDSIRLTYTTSYPKFLKYIFPIKAMLGESLFYQTSNKEFNRTFRTGPDAYRPVFIKSIYDPLGVPKSRDDPERYPRPPGAPSYVVKNVSAPIIRLNNEILLFDFFEHNIETFDSIGHPKRLIPIDFHSITRTYLWFYKERELNQNVFKQKILKDESTGKIYALFHQIGHRALLKEIDPENGNIINEIEIPDLPNIDNIKVHGDVIYFTYQVKSHPYYTNLYRMKI